MTGPLVDEVTRPWWDATRERRLVLQRCAACGAHQHYPGPVCRACGGSDLVFVPAAGTGTVRSCTVVHRAPSPDFTPPYTVALVALAEGPVLTTALVGADPDGWRCDEPVVVDWRPLPDGRHLPVFRRPPERPSWSEHGLRAE